MFRDRALQVNVVKKTPKSTEEGQNGMSFEDKLVMVSVSIERGIKKIGLAVCAYVILDTVRKVAIEKTKSH